MWYVIQTLTGKEEELIMFIRTILKKELFTDCFLIKTEWIKRLGGEWKIQVRPLFPGYIFIESNCPEEVFLELKGVPKFSKILGSEKFIFSPVNEEEKSFLTLISSESGILQRKSEIDYSGNRFCNSVKNDELNQRVVKLTEVTMNEDGSIASMHGILQHFKKNIVKINLHKRFVVIKVDLFRRERTLIFGIKLLQNRQEKEI